MSVQGNHVQASDCGSDNDKSKVPSVSEVEMEQITSTSYEEVESEGLLEICRVCQCNEPDKRGDAALVFLDITPPIDIRSGATTENCLGDKNTIRHTCGSNDDPKLCEREPGLVKFVGPEGEIFVCNADLEAGKCHYQDALINLGCSCKNDLALAHYACALRWFINHGSTVCEICGSVATRIRATDFQKVVASLKDCETLRERTAAGVVASADVQAHPGVDPDAVAAIRRQRLTEISLWFSPQNHLTTVSQAAPEQASTAPAEDAAPSESVTTKWAVEGTGILVATGLLTVTLAWLLAPRVGKRTARSGLHILLGGLCALTVVVFLRFAVLPRIKYGPARYWAILFVFWFLVFGIWASRTRGSHST
ncbi:uncharacterized protein LOC116266929 [Nymphaea colorata]|nr:uncharacterized protein LOC116266929 [Nymphaea colorata]XP_031504297.1 uncharacterized protein LOC116266929 [Nymphaea colorata]XP_031504299.1 uncharacterized protein LOC116266929 [Nymphaea colorata]XP_031504300.1 uncharacterized protein LOC116266929 [Nymphaea colorata]